MPLYGYKTPRSVNLIKGDGISVDCKYPVGHIPVLRSSIAVIDGLRVQQQLCSTCIGGCDDGVRCVSRDGNAVAILLSSDMALTRGILEYARCVKFCNDKKLLEKFRESAKLLDMVQKGLSDYLETKRAGFSRFYFLSNDELLEILSQTKVRNSGRKKHNRNRYHAVNNTADSVVGFRHPVVVVVSLWGIRRSYSVAYLWYVMEHVFNIQC